MDKVNDHYGEFIKSIKSNEIQMWSSPEWWMDKTY
jgi:hypothetical protein